MNSRVPTKRRERRGWRQWGELYGGGIWTGELKRPDQPNSVTGLQGSRHFFKDRLHDGGLIVDRDFIRQKVIAVVRMIFHGRDRFPSRRAVIISVEGNAQVP